MKYFNITLAFLFTCVCFFNCIKKTQEDKQFVLPLYLHEQDNVIIHAIEDSILLQNKDSLFFRIQVFMQDLSEIRGYVVINKNGMGSFIVPKNAAYIRGFFYNKNNKSEKVYSRIIYEGQKPVRNAYQEYQNDTSIIFLKEELKNYPNNYSSYSSYLSHIANQNYLGQISDTIYNTLALKYLKIVEGNITDENPADMEALASLYAYNQDYDKAQSIILNMLTKYGMSNYLRVAITRYNFSYEIFRKNKATHDYFLDSLLKQVGQTAPKSPTSHIVSYSPNTSIYAKYYQYEDIIANTYNFLNKVDSSNMYARKQLVSLLLKKNQLANAKKEAFVFLDKTKRYGWQHFIPNNKRGDEDILGEMASAYILLSDIYQAENENNKAITYLDTAYHFSKQVPNNLLLNYILDSKASIQRKTNQHNNALKTYETLYQETKEESVLDSIKVLFKETQQEKGFEGYAKNLREIVENKNKEPKKLAANFSIKDMSGYEIKLSDWKGRVVVLNFWANYCLPCAKEIPLLNKLWRETQTKDIIFLAITKDSPLVVQRFTQRQKEMFSFSVLPDAKQLSDVYDVNLVPTQIVINKKGEIVHRETGFSGNIDKLKQVVLEELSK